MIAALALASTALAQLDPYTLTVTASRSISVQPDQASLSVYVDADASLGLNDILNVVQGLGLTSGELVQCLQSVEPIVQQFGASNSAGRAGMVVQLDRSLFQP